MAKKITKKTYEEHTEDALYREVWEEVNTQKILDFIHKHLKLIIAAALALIIVVVTAVTVRNIKHNNEMEIAASYESAVSMDPYLAREALSRLAKTSRGGMGDLALFKAYMLAMDNNDRADALAKLEKLASDGSTRDFRDLALVQLAMLSSEKMQGDDFQKMMSPLLTKRSPFYFTGLLLVAEKYISENKSDRAQPFLEKLTSDSDAPNSISAIAEMMQR